MRIEEWLERARQEEAGEYGSRPDGTSKGPGFLGEIDLDDGRVATELSVGVEIDGQEQLIPTLVPGLNEEQIAYIKQGGDPRERPDIMKVAVRHAKQRLKQGKDAFAAQQEEQGPAFEPVTEKELTPIERVLKQARQEEALEASQGAPSGPPTLAGHPEQESRYAFEHGGALEGAEIEAVSPEEKTWSPEEKTWQPLSPTERAHQQMRELAGEGPSPLEQIWGGITAPGAEEAAPVVGGYIEANAIYGYIEAKKRLAKDDYEEGETEAKYNPLEMAMIKGGGGGMGGAGQEIASGMFGHDVPVTAAEEVPVTKERDQALVQEYEEKQKAREEATESFWGEVGLGIRNLPGYMTDIAMGGGLIKAGARGGRKAMIRALGKAARRKYVRELTRTVGWLGASAALTAATPHRTAGATARQQLAGKSPAHAFMLGLGQTWGELAGEIAGPGITRVGGKVLSKVPGFKRLSKKLSGMMGRLWKQTHGADASIAKAAKRLGYHGMLEELGEERLTAGLQMAVGAREMKVLDAIWPGWRQIAQEFMVLTAPGAAKAGAQVVAGEYVKSQREQKVKEQQERARRKFYRDVRQEMRGTLPSEATEEGVTRPKGIIEIEEWEAAKEEIEDALIGVIEDYVPDITNAREVALRMPKLAQQIADLPKNPSRADFEGLGIERRMGLEERRELVQDYRRALGMEVEEVARMLEEAEAAPEAEMPAEEGEAEEEAVEEGPEAEEAETLEQEGRLTKEEFQALDKESLAADLKADLENAAEEQAAAEPEPEPQGQVPEPEPERPKKKTLRKKEEVEKEEIEERTTTAYERYTELSDMPASERIEMLPPGMREPARQAEALLSDPRVSYGHSVTSEQAATVLGIEEGQARELLRWIHKEAMPFEGQPKTELSGDPHGSVLRAASEGEVGGEVTPTRDLRMNWIRDWLDSGYTDRLFEMQERDPTDPYDHVPELAFTPEQAEREIAEQEQEAEKPKAPKKAKTKAQKQVERAQAKTDELADMLRRKGLMSNPWFDPELISMVADVTAEWVVAGVYSFNEFITKMARQFGKDLTLKMAPLFERAWSRVGQRAPEGLLSEVEPVDKILSRVTLEEKEEGDARTERPDEHREPSDRDVSEEAEGAGEGGGAGVVRGGAGAEGVRDEDEGAGRAGEERPGGGDIGPGVVAAEPGEGEGGELGERGGPAAEGGEGGGEGGAEGQPEAGAVANHRIASDDIIAPKGEKAQIRANIEALRLLKQLEGEDRDPTEAEKKRLAKFTGWGNLAPALDTNRGANYEREMRRREEIPSHRIWWEIGEDKPTKRMRNWVKKYADAYMELKELLTDEEMREAQDSTLNAHYTSRPVIEAMWSVAARLGFESGTVLEPGAGIGHMFGLMPEGMREGSQLVAVEQESITARIFEKLYPGATLFAEGLEDVKLPAASVDLVIGNVPFARIGPEDAQARYGMEMNLHDYFIMRSLDALKPGGVAVLISTYRTMDQSKRQRDMLAKHGDLLGAFRLPKTAFKANAGTEVVTDILVLRRPTQGARKGSPWTGLNAEHLSLPDQKIPNRIARKHRLSDADKKKMRKRVENARDFEHLEMKLNPENDKHEYALAYALYYHGREVLVNEYYREHPEHVLGEHTLSGSQYSYAEYAVDPKGGPEAFLETLRKQIATLPSAEDIGPVEETGGEGLVDFRKIKEAENLPEGHITERDGKIVVVSGGRFVDPAKRKKSPKQFKTKKGQAQARRFMGLRDQYRAQISLEKSEEATSDEIEESREELNRLYDEYVEAHGRLSAKGNDWLESDPDFWRTVGLETVKWEKGKLGLRKRVWKKSDIFRKRLHHPRQLPTHAENAQHAVNVSLGYYARLDVPLIAQLLDKTEEEAEAELAERDLAFKNPETGYWEAPSRYLSGNVRRKLHQARTAAESDDNYQRNVEALEEVQPERKAIQDHHFKLGAAWIPDDVVEAFARDILDMPSMGVRYVRSADRWRVSAPSGHDRVAANTSTYGIEEKEGHQILQQTLNRKQPEVKTEETYYDDQGREQTRRVRDEEKTQAAIEKQKVQKEKFYQWANARDEVLERMEDAWNEAFNFWVQPRWDGTRLETPTASDALNLRDYQQDGVWRGLTEGRAIWAHAVGTGKTRVIATTAIEGKRLGLWSKPLIVVKNATLLQFASQVQTFFPEANILVATKKDLEKKNRRKFLAQIAANEYDAVIITQSQFEKIPDDPERAEAWVLEEIAELDADMRRAEAEEGRKSVSVKEMARKRNALYRSLDKIRRERAQQEDIGVNFEDMGVDALFVDEAHAYKKPFFQTQYNRIRGVQTQANATSQSLMLKARWIQEKMGGRGVFLATGTPVTNTVVETWHMIRYVAPDILDDFQLDTFDRFATTLIEEELRVEQNAGGQWQQYRYLSKYKEPYLFNQVVASTFDSVTTEDLRQKQKELGGFLPEYKYGRNKKNPHGQPQHIVQPITPAVEGVKDWILRLHEAWGNLPGREKVQHREVPLLLYMANRRVTVDARLLFPQVPDESGSKLNRCVEKAYQIWLDEKERKGTQLIFSDQSGPMNTEGLRHFAAAVGEENIDLGETRETAAQIGDDFVYYDIKRKLVEKGVPEGEIAVMSESTSDADRKKLFEKVNAGTIRILIGGKPMQEGVNVQERLYAIHHLDTPWMPAELIQRTGRMVRAGNRYEMVEELMYGMAETLDAAIWTKVALKAKFIGQVTSGKMDAEFEDPGGRVQITGEEAVGYLTGDTRVQERVELQNKVRQLSYAKQSVRDQAAQARDKVHGLESQLTTYEDNVEHGRQVVAALEDMPEKKADEGWEGKVDGQEVEGWSHLVNAIDDAIERREKQIEKATKEGKIDRGSGRISKYQKFNYESKLDADHRMVQVKIGPVTYSVYANFWKGITEEEENEFRWRGERIARVTVDHEGGQWAERVGGVEPTTILRTIGGLRSATQDAVDQFDARIERMKQQLEAYHKEAEVTWDREDELRAAQDRLEEIEQDLHGNTSQAYRAPGRAKPKKTSDAKPSEPLTERERKAPTVPVNTTEEEEEAFEPGVFRRGIDSVLAVLRPAHRSETARKGGRIIRHRKAEEARANLVAATALKNARKVLGRLSDDDVIEFIDRMERKQPQGDEKLQEVADTLREILDEWRAEIQKWGLLQKFYETYFPHIWKNPKKAKSVTAKLLGRGRPMEGPKSFAKPRTYVYTKDAIREGLEPVTYNPVDLALLKIAEMAKFVSANKIQQDYKNKGMAQFVYATSQPREGYAYVNDPLFEEYAPPYENIEEMVDKAVWEKLTGFAQRLGVTTERVAKLRSKWGEAKGDQEIVTKFAGPESILAHEIGHILNERYGVLSWLRQSDDKSEEGIARRKTINKELRALADARIEGMEDEVSDYYKRYIRQDEEKAAVLVEALVHAPDKFKETAPTVFEEFTRFLGEHNDPTLSELLEIRPSLTLQTQEIEYPVPGLRLLGRWAVPEEVALLLNNQLAPGLRNSQFSVVRAPFKAVRFMSNAMVQAELGVSFFHGLFTTFNAISSSLAVAERDIFATKGGQLRGLGRLGMTATLVTPVIENLWHGSRMMKAGGQDMEDMHPKMRLMVQALMVGGGRFKMHWVHRTRAVEALKRSLHDLFRSGKLKKMGWGLAKTPFQLPFAILDAAARPLLEWWVPRQKLGTFYVMAKHEMKRLGTTDLEDPDLREALTQVWDRVDNRLGQLTYDNLFWNSILKDGLFAAFRTVGWNFGTADEFGGAPIDVLTTKQRMDRGDAWLSHKQAYVVAEVTTMYIMGSVVYYLFHGEPPERFVDAFYIPTGETNPDGTPEKVALPTYIKDLVAFKKAPGETVQHKLSPVWGTIAAIIENEDFYGVEIRHPDDPWYEQAWDVARYVGSRFVPFSVHNYRKQVEAGADPHGRALTAFLGVIKAPASVSRSPAHQLMIKHIVERIPQGSRTREEWQLTQWRKEIRQIIRKGGSPSEHEHWDEFTDKEKKLLWTSGKKDPFVARFEMQTFEEACAVYAVCDEKEREKVRPVLTEKRQKAWDSYRTGGGPRNYPEINKLYKELMRQEE